jgi:hypothetical protein
MKLQTAIPILLMVLVASFAGGAFSHFMLTGRPAAAQDVGNPKWLRTVTLYLVDESTDQVRGVLTIDGGAASLALRDSKGVDRLDMDVDSAGTPTVVLHNGDKGRAELAVRNGQASLTLAGSTGGMTFSLQDGPVFEVTGAGGNPSVRLAIEEGLPTLQMFDRSGNVIFQAPPVEETED